MACTAGTMACRAEGDFRGSGSVGGRTVGCKGMTRQLYLFSETTIFTIILLCLKAAERILSCRGAFRQHDKCYRAVIMITS